MSYMQIVPRICMVCGRLPCACPIGVCSICNAKLNLDAIGESLAGWNLKHQTQTGCTGFIKDPRVKGFDMTPKEFAGKIANFENDSKRQQEEIRDLNSQIKQLVEKMKK